MAAVMQVLLVIHRYLGVAVGLLMTLWCLSGFVMIYQPYPHLTQAERLAGLERLDLTGCCNAERLPAAASGAKGLAVEMLAGAPVLRLTGADGSRQVYDLATGRPVELVTSAQALQVARAYAAGHGITGAPRLIGQVGHDQWTLEGAGSRGPVYRIGLGDRAGSQVYVAARSGLVVQDTTRAERVWSWLGAIPHWLYPTVLRQNVPLWSQVVIWTSLIGGFLTATGLYVGIARFRRYKSGRWSPYRGWFYWHHIIGLVFGILTLTWVVSGLFTMNPWGYLETDVGAAEQQALAGAPVPDPTRTVLPIAAALAGGDVVRLQTSPLGGRLYVLATSRTGLVTRYDAAGRPSPVGRSELTQALAAVGPVASLTLLTRPDAYYDHGYDGPVVLPAWRAVLAGPGRVALYLDARSGELVGAFDDVARQARWVRVGLHDLDFPGLKARPVWDVVVLLLLLGVTAVAVTGTWMALQRVGRDAAAVRRALKRPG